MQAFIGSGRELEQLFLNMVDHFKDQIESDEEPTLFDSIYLLGASLKKPNSNPAEFCTKFIMEYIKDNMSDELDGGTVQNEIGSDALLYLSDALNEHYHSMVMNRTNAMIEPEGRVDTRNAAMSSVAELLNVPNLIARSKPMQIIDADGNKVNGTFMTEAEGMDPDHLPPEAEKITIDAANKTDGKAFKSIADLQVLDYICGNIDRHPSNFFMKFNKKGKLADIQGIDNDCSCGKIIPEFGKGFNRMVGLKDLMVMSESMCNKAKHMTPAQLKFALRGYGLSEAEMNAACERLRHIKAMITKYSKRYPDVKHPKRSSLLIVPDDQFKNLKLDDLAREKEMEISGQRVTLEANMFAMVKNNLEKFKDMRREQEEERIANERELHTLKSEIAIGSDNRANPGAIVKNAEQAEKLNKEMGKRTNFWKFFWKSSPAYEKMEKATQDYFKYQRKLKERLELAKDPSYTGKAKNAERNFDWEAVVSREDMEKMRDLARKMYEAADAYCDGKKDLDPETARDLAAGCRFVRMDYDYEENYHDLRETIFRLDLDDKMKAAHQVNDSSSLFQLLQMTDFCYLGHVWMDRKGERVICADFDDSFCCLPVKSEDGDIFMGYVIRQDEVRLAYLNEVLRPLIEEVGYEEAFINIKALY